MKAFTRRSVLDGLKVCETSNSMNPTLLHSNHEFAFRDSEHEKQIVCGHESIENRFLSI